MLAPAVFAAPVTANKAPRPIDKTWQHGKEQKQNHNPKVARRIFFRRSEGTTIKAVTQMMTGVALCGAVGSPIKYCAFLDFLAASVALAVFRAVHFFPRHRFAKFAFGLNGRVTGTKAVGRRSTARKAA